MGRSGGGWRCSGYRRRIVLLAWRDFSCGDGDGDDWDGR